MTPPARRAGAPDRDEVEGFLAGVDHRLLSVSEPERSVLVADATAARAAFRSGDLVTAESILLALEERLDELEGEPELSEFPRGLVGYVPIGDRGHATPLEEDPLSNRLLLVGRLRDVVAAEGRDVAEAGELLRQARAAFDAGDRLAARGLVDRAHALLERDPTAATEE